MKFNAKTFRPQGEEPSTGINPKELSEMVTSLLPVRHSGEEGFSSLAQQISEGINASIRSANQFIGGRNYLFTVDVAINRSQDGFEIKVVCPKSIQIPSPKGVIPVSMEELPSHQSYMNAYGALRVLYHLIKNVPDEFLKTATFSVKGLESASNEILTLYNEINSKFPSIACGFVQELETIRGNAGPNSRMPKDRSIAQISDLSSPVPFSLDTQTEDLPTIQLYGGWAFDASGKLSFNWFIDREDAEKAVDIALPPPQILDENLERQRLKLTEAVEGAKEFIQKRQIDKSLAEISGDGGSLLLTLSFETRSVPIRGHLVKDPVQKLRDGTNKSIVSIRSLECAFEVLRRLLVSAGPEESGNLILILPPLFGEEKMPALNAYHRMRPLLLEGLAAVASLLPPKVSLEDYRREPSLIHSSVSELMVPKDPFKKDPTPSGVSIVGGYVREKRSIRIGNSPRPISGLFFRWFVEPDEALHRIREAFPEHKEESSAASSNYTTYSSKINETLIARITELSEKLGITSAFLKRLDGIPGELNEADQFVQGLLNPSDFGSNTSGVAQLIEHFEVIAVTRSVLNKKGGKYLGLAKNLREVHERLGERIKNIYLNDGLPERLELFEYQRSLEDVRKEVCSLEGLTAVRYLTDSVQLKPPTYEEKFQDILINNESILKHFVEASSIWDNTDERAAFKTEIGKIFEVPDSFENFVDFSMNLASLLRGYNNNPPAQAEIIARCRARINTLVASSEDEESLMITATIVAQLRKCIEVPQDLAQFCMQFLESKDRAHRQANAELNRRTPKDYDHSENDRSDNRMKLYFRAYDNWQKLEKPSSRAKPIGTFLAALIQANQLMEGESK